MMSRNAGKKAEEKIVKMLESSDSFTVRNSKKELVKIDIQPDMVYTPGHGTKCKFDVRVGDYRLQVKSSTGHSATIFSTTIENLVKAGKREMFDVQPFLSIWNVLTKVEAIKKVRLHELFEMSEIEDVVRYFLFEGTAKSQEIPTLQANYLLYVNRNNEMILCNKMEAMEFLFHKLYCEIKVKNGKPQLSLRVGR